MRLLYHFAVSPYSRRTRLALMHKGLDVELRDALSDAALLAEAQRLGPLKTVPILIEPDGRSLGDSTAITHYLDRAYPAAPTLWPATPEDARAMFDVAVLVETALTNVIDLGIRYHALCDSSAWESIRQEHVGRAQRALNALAERTSSLPRPTVAPSGWSAADIWVFTAVTWLELLPSIAADAAFARQVVALGAKLPSALQRWADQHRDRADARALDASP